MIMCSSSKMSKTQKFKYYSTIKFDFYKHVFSSNISITSPKYNSICDGTFVSTSFLSTILLSTTSIDVQEVVEIFLSSPIRLETRSLCSPSFENDDVCGFLIQNLSLIIYNNESRRTLFSGEKLQDSQILEKYLQKKRKGPYVNWTLK